MAAYITIAEMKERFGESSIEDLERVSNITRAINDSSLEMDSLLSGSYSLPIAIGNDPITKDFLGQICANLTYAKMHTQDAPELILKRADQSRSALMNIAKGLVEIPTLSGAPYPRKLNSATTPVSPLVARSGGGVFSDSVMDKMCMTDALRGDHF